MKRSLSTGEFAKYFGVGHRTVLRWIKQGYLRAFQLPGRGDNRIPIEEGVRFMRENNIPVPQEMIDAVSPLKVLIVEDEESVVGMIERCLDQYGFRFQTASDGLKAGAALMNFKPHLLILDLRIPELDGFKVLEFVKESEELKGTKVLVIAGLEKDKLEEAKKAGANSVLAKPFEPKELVKTVAELLKLSP